MLFRSNPLAQHLFVLLLSKGRPTLFATATNTGPNGVFLPTAMQQSLTSADIVDLVRAAMGREMQVLRDELNLMNQAKGKTKHGRGKKHTIGTRTGGRRKQRGPAFTEEEYKEMLDQGIDPDEIKRLAEDLWEDQVGFPEWSDPEFSDEDEGWTPKTHDWLDFVPSHPRNQSPASHGF